jgi:hypothetical protein
MESQSTIDNDKKPIIVNRRIIQNIEENLHGWPIPTGSIGIVKEAYTNPDTLRVDQSLILRNLLTL